jgi:hypothetical protein
MLLLPLVVVAAVVAGVVRRWRLRRAALGRKHSHNSMR